MNSKLYQIAIIGPIPRDHITTYQGKVIEKYGCILYPTIILAKLFEQTAKIYPVSHIRKIDELAIKKILADLPGVNLTHISTKEDRGDVIRLRFIDQNERVKTMSAFMDPITIDDVKNLLNCDAFLFLPVTDFEISLAILKFIKAHSNGLIIFDAHGPTKTMTTLGDRLFKFWVHRDLWLPYIDILQMNLREAKCCLLKKYYTLEELEDDEPLTISELPKLAKQCLKKGIKALYVTLDAQGCVVYNYDQNYKLQETFVPAVTVQNPIDSTGCGDSFAGGLTFGLLTTHDYLKAAQYANALGAQCVQASNFGCFATLDETKHIVHNTYGAT